MFYVTLVALFLSVAVLLFIVSLQVNAFIKNAYTLIEKVENHIYL